MAETKNHLGLDKFQVTVIKSNYNSTKPIRKLIEKNQAKIEAAKEKTEKAIEALMNKFKEAVNDLVNENKAYQSQIDMLDKFTLETTKQSCGLELTSEQVIEFLDNPAAFTAYKQEMQGADMFDEQEGSSESGDLNAEEESNDPDYFDAEEKENESEEIKEEV